jgi:hypothetical protein
MMYDTMLVIYPYSKLNNDYYFVAMALVKLPSIDNDRHSEVIFKVVEGLIRML